MKLLLTLLSFPFLITMTKLQAQSITLNDLMVYVKQDLKTFNDFVMNSHEYSYHGSVDDINAKGQLYIKGEYFNGKSVTGSIGKFIRYNGENTSTIEINTINKNLYNTLISGLTSEGFESVTTNKADGATWVMYRKLLQGSGYIFGVIIDDNDLNKHTCFLQYSYLR